MGKILRKFFFWAMVLCVSGFLFNPLAAMFSEPFFEKTFDILGVDTENWAKPVLAAVVFFFESDLFRSFGVVVLSLGCGVWGHWIVTKFDKRNHITKPVEPVENCLFDLSWQGQNNPDGFDLKVRFTTKERIDHLKIVGSYAKSIYYMNGTAKWEKNPSTVLLEKDYMAASEEIVLDAIFRPNKKHGFLTVFGSEISLTDNDKINGELIRFQISASSDSDESKIEEILYFVPNEVEKTTYSLHPSDVSHILENDN